MKISQGKFKQMLKKLYSGSLLCDNNLRGVRADKMTGKDFKNWATLEDGFFECVQRTEISCDDFVENCVGYNRTANHNLHSVITSNTLLGFNLKKNKAYTIEVRLNETPPNRRKFDLLMSCSTKQLLKLSGIKR